MGHPFRHSYAAGSDWRPAAAIAVVAIQAVHILWTLAPPLDGAAAHWAANVFVDTSAIIAAALAVLVFVRFRGSRLGLAWSLLALGLFFGVFAEVSWSFLDLTRPEVPFPSIADVGYVGAYLPVFVGLVLMPSAPNTASGRAKLTLDTLILIAALAIVSWFVVVESVLRGGESPAAQAVAIFYPFADLAVIFAAFILVTRAARTKSATVLSLLAAAYFATGLSDMLYAHLTEAGYEVGSYLDIGWVAGYNFISCAALARLDPAAASQPFTSKSLQDMTFWPSLLPYLALVPLFSLLILEAGSGNVSLLLAVGLLGVVALVVVRQLITIYDNTRLNRELLNLTATLEYRVKDKTMQLLQQRSHHGEDVDSAGARPNGADEPMGDMRPVRRD